MSNVQRIPFDKTGVNPLLIEYIQQNPKVRSLYNLFPNREAFFTQAEKKLSQYQNRSVLVEVLDEQMGKLTLSQKQKLHLSQLKKDSSVTVTTGHQLNLMTGPLYFIYKILQTIKTCDDLNSEKGEIHFAPIYWMATEDHDFNEINHFYAFQKKWKWESNQKGAVGKFDLEGIQEVFNSFEKVLPPNNFGDKIKRFISDSYLSSKNLAQATRQLVHDLLGEYGIIILDADDSRLKQLALPYFKDDLLNSTAYKDHNSRDFLTQNYNEQAYIRPINLFYLNELGRNRIEKQKQKYRVVDTPLEFTKEEILETLQKQPENFSPNVILRPLYQEIILPNVAYIGGGGEIAYWLQLKSFFDTQGVMFPLLIMRNSMLIVTKNEKRKAEKLNYWDENLFQPAHQWTQNWVSMDNELFRELEDKENELNHLFESLTPIAKSTNATFNDMLQAQKQKQKKGFAKLRKRLVKAEAIKQQDDIARFKELNQAFFPGGTWQERKINFTQFYAIYGNFFFTKVYDSLTPFCTQFLVLTIDDSLEK